MKPLTFLYHISVDEVIVVMYEEYEALINNTQNRNVEDSPIALRRLGVIRVHNWHYIESEFARECIIFLFLL